MATLLPSRPPEIAPDVFRVLVVDDDADCANSLDRLLGRAGFNVSVAPDGPSALAESRDHPPDVVLLDLSLPGMDGYEVARRLHEGEGKGRPAFMIAMSGFADDAERREEVGIDLHLLKPADPAELIALLERFRCCVQTESDNSW